MFLDPTSLDAPSRYKLLIGAIVPRPIAWVSTLSRSGKANLAPFSFFAGVGATPMTLLFCPANGDDGEPKDTLRNLLESTGPGEFVVNIVSHDLRIAMSASAEALAHGESEWDLAGLEPEASRNVRPARVRGVRVAFECVAQEILRLAEGEPGGANVVVGRIVGVHAEDGVIDERHRIDPAKLDAIGRMAGLGYCTTRDRFEIPWGRAALEDASSG